MRAVASGVILVALGILMAVLAVEATGRVAPGMLPQRIQDATGLVGRSGIGEFTRLQATMVSGDPDLGIRLRPGVDLFLRGHPDYAYHVRTSELDRTGLGVRGTVPAGRPFAVAVGDSFTFGVGVEETDTWVHRLSQALGASVVDLGLPSACLTQFTRMYTRYGAPLHPRVVLWEAYTPDIDKNVWFDMWLRHGGGPFYDWQVWARAVGTTGRGPIGAVKAWLDSHSITFNIVKLVVAGSGYHYRSPTMDIFFGAAFHFSLADPVTAQGWRLTRTAILDAAAMARREGATLVVVYFPQREEVYAPLLRGRFLVSEQGFGVPQRMLRQFTAEHKIDFVDLTPEMAAHGAAGEQLYFPHDGHWNERGNALVAALIEQYLLAHHLAVAAGVMGR